MIGRLLTAMVTPFREGRVDYEGAKKLAKALVKSGSDGVVVSGTTGESPTLKKEEKLRLFEEVKKALPDKDVVAGTGSYSTEESVELSKEAEKLGVDGLLLVTPYYNKPPQDGLYEHFKRIASSVSIPCILYNIPSRTGVNLLPKTVKRLLEIDNIVGVKESSGDLRQISNMIADGVRIWSGNDHDIFPIMRLGGYGAISVASHLMGRSIKEMMEKTMEGKIEEAFKIHKELTPLFDILFIVSNPIPIKYALKTIGFDAGPPRLPLVPPDEETARRIDEVLGKYEVEVEI